MRIASGVVVALALIWPQGPAAAGCNDDVVARIVFPPGEYCWAYSGRATSFVGEFGAHQHISVQMSGEMAEWNEKTQKETTSIAPRSPDVTGPGDFYAGGGEGKVSFTTPRAGRYNFSFSPCAMWHGNGTVQICAQ